MNKTALRGRFAASLWIPWPKRPAYYLWAVLIARIYEVFPLLCPICGGKMCIVAFITDSADICQLLEYIGVDAEPPRITPARGPPLWDSADAQAGEGVEATPDWDQAAQAAPRVEVNQRVSWQRVKGWQQRICQRCGGEACARHCPKQIMPKNFGRLAQRKHPGRPRCPGL